MSWRGGREGVGEGGREWVREGGSELSECEEGGKRLSCQTS